MTPNETRRILPKPDTSGSVWQVSSGPATAAPVNCRNCRNQTAQLAAAVRAAKELRRASVAFDENANVMTHAQYVRARDRFDDTIKALDGLEERIG